MLVTKVMTPLDRDNHSAGFASFIIDGGRLSREAAKDDGLRMSISAYDIKQLILLDSSQSLDPFHLWSVMANDRVGEAWPYFRLSQHDEGEVSSRLLAECAFLLEKLQGRPPRDAQARRLGNAFRDYVLEPFESDVAIPFRSMLRMDRDKFRQALFFLQGLAYSALTVERVEDKLRPASLVLLSKQSQKASPAEGLDQRRRVLQMIADVKSLSNDWRGCYEAAVDRLLLQGDVKCAHGWVGAAPAWLLALGARLAAASEFLDFVLSRPESREPAVMAAALDEFEMRFAGLPQAPTGPGARKA